MPSLFRALRPLSRDRCNVVLDIGCGFGGLTHAVGTALGAHTLHGVDIDSSVLEEAREKGVDALRIDVEHEPLPYEDGSMDLILSLGMLDYLPTFDGLLMEVRRVLRPGGSVLFSVPNLGSWQNRLALLLGYQPRDVEISDRAVVGTLPYYRGHVPAGHIHTPTLRAFRDLMHVHGFEETKVTGAAWITRPVPWPLATFDRLIALRPSLARRFFYLGEAGVRPVQLERSGWWRGRQALQG